MDNLKMHSLDGVQRNIELIGKLFPNAITEVKRNGKVEHAIDFDVLRQELSDSIVEGREERYQFTWPDKKKAMLAANAPITATLRPVVADSVGKDGTPGGFDSENLYIEGDNLEVLKLLQETYLGKVKMIYIDPPYNTGKDFIYTDNFEQNARDYMENSGQYDEEGNRMVQNTESNGRFHTDWLNKIYPRLRIAKDLLASDGVIVISISYREVHHLVAMCESLFGGHQVVTVTVQTSGGKPSGGFNYLHEYLVWIVPKDFIANPVEAWGGKDRTPFEGLTLSTFDKEQRPNQAYPIFIDEKTGLLTGVGASLQELIGSGKYTGDKLNYVYDYSCAPIGSVAIWPVTAKGKDCVWRQIPERILSDWKKGYIKVTRNSNSKNQNQYSIQYLPSGVIEKIENGELEVIGHESNAPTLIFGANRTVGGQIPTIWLDKDNFTVNGTQGFKDLFPENDKLFDYSKPIALMKTILQATSNSDDFILDFFFGSATTAHAVMQLNAEDGGHRKFIMVQLPEKTDEKKEAYKAGYKNICEIGKERIRRAGRKIKEDAGLTAPADLDIGFRCLRLDESNMKPVYYTPEETQQQDLFSLVDNVKSDRTPEDLLFQVMLDLGVLLSSPIEATEIAGKKVFNVANGFLLACFDHDVTDETVKAIAQMKPYYAVFRDSSMANDSVATNFDQIFETYSPETVRKVL